MMMVAMMMPTVMPALMSSRPLRVTLLSLLPLVLVVLVLHGVLGLVAHIRAGKGPEDAVAAEFVAHRVAADAARYGAEDAALAWLAFLPWWALAVRGVWIARGGRLVVGALLGELVRRLLVVAGAC